MQHPNADPDPKPPEPGDGSDGGDTQAPPSDDGGASSD